MRAKNTTLLPACCLGLFCCATLGPARERARIIGAEPEGVARTGRTHGLGVRIDPSDARHRKRKLPVKARRGYYPPLTY